MDPNQTPVRDPVTLTAVSRTTGERDSVTATTLVAAATLAVISRFESRLEEGRVVVEWSTASEAGTLGFHLERWDGRRFRRLDDRLLPALQGAPQGGDYRYADAGTSPGRSETYRLVEQEVWGTKRVYGPFEVISGESGAADQESFRGERRSRDFERAARRTSVRRYGAMRADQRAGRRGTRARIDVEQPGLVSVAAPELAAALDVNEWPLRRWIRSGRLRLQNRGEAVSWLPSPDGSGILFVGEAVDSLYTDRNAYQVRSGRGSLVRRANGRPRWGDAPAAFRDRLRLEQDVWPLTSVITDPEQDYWFWDYLFAGAPGSDRRQYAVSLHGLPPSGADAVLEVRLQGAMDAAADPDHHVMVLVNGEPVGEARWDGNDAHTLTAAVPHALLREGDNVVELAALVGPGVPFDLVYLNSFELEYERLYRALDDQIQVTAQGASLLRVEGFSGPDVLVLEVSDPRDPVLVERTRVEASGGSFAVSFASEPQGRYLVARAAAARAAADVVGDEHAFLASRGNAADVVLIAPEGLEAGAEALAGIRRSEGLQARVVRLQDVYDEFSGGIADPLAIRSFLESAVRRWAVAPRYVVLVGDGTFDHRNRMGQGGSLLPVAMAGTPQGLVPSDNRLADLVGDDGVPELAIGRLPVQGPEELDAWVAKSAAYSAASGTWPGRALWIADNPDAGGEFAADAEALRERLPDSLAAEPVYLGQVSRSEARTAILGSLREGVGLVSYHGHGGLDRLADEGLLVTADVQTLGNLDRLPVVTALTCVVGRFDLPGYDSLGEALLLREDGGAIALLAPSGFSLNHEADAIGRGFVDALAGDGELRLGDAVRAGLAAHLALHDRQLHVPFLYSLLGDPSARPAW
jgi:hypothetical protein